MVPASNRRSILNCSWILMSVFINPLPFIKVISNQSKYEDPVTHIYFINNCLKERSNIQLIKNNNKKVRTPNKIGLYLFLYRHIFIRSNYQFYYYHLSILYYYHSLVSFFIVKFVMVRIRKLK